MTRIEGQEGFELLDGLVPLALPIKALSDEEPGARGIGRLGMSLDDLLEIDPRLGVLGFFQVLLALSVEIGGGQQGLGARFEEFAKRGAPSEQEECRHQRRGKREEMTTHQQGVRFPIAVICTARGLESQGPIGPDPGFRGVSPVAPERGGMGCHVGRGAAIDPRARRGPATYRPRLVPHSGNPTVGSSTGTIGEDAGGGR